MTMPRHHVQKCGLRDLNIAMIGMVTASQVTVAEAVVEDRFPGSETICPQGRFGVVLDRVVHGHVVGQEACDLEEPEPEETTSDEDDRNTDGRRSEDVAERDSHRSPHR